MKRYPLFLLSLLVIFGLLLSACQQQAENNATAEPQVDSTTQAGAGEGYPAATNNQAEGYPAPQQGQAPEQGAYPGPGTSIRVGTDATFPPFELVDETTQEITGFDVELMRAIADLNGWQVEFVNQPFDPLLVAVEQCQLDAAIAAITITPDREEKMLFSDPYINAGQIVVVAAGNNEISSKDDLSGKTIGAQLGTTGEIEAKAIEGGNYRPYDTYDLAFLDLINGQLDAVIADYPLALDFIGQNPDRLQVVGEPFTDENYGIAVCKNRQDLIDPINSALQTLQDNGTLQQLEEEWLVNQGE